MASVTFSNGLTISDDANPLTGLDGGGHKARFVPALAGVVSEADRALAAANSAINAAASAANAPGTNASSTTPNVIGLGQKYFVIQTGKAYSVGQTLVFASLANPLNQMIGVCTGHNSFTGDIGINCTSFGGSGTFSDWIVGLSAVGGVLPTRQVNGGGLVTGGGDLSANRTLTVTKATVADLWAGTVGDKVVTPDILLAAEVSQPFGDAATITLDGNTGRNFHMSAALGGSRALANPVNFKPGQSGRIRLLNNASGNGQIVPGTVWKFPGGFPGLAQIANAIYSFGYYVHDAAFIECGLLQDMKS